MIFMKDNRKLWPPKLRSALKKALMTHGMDRVPDGIQIKYLHNCKEDSRTIEIRTNPDATERVSKHQYVRDFHGTDECIARFLDIAIDFSHRVERRNRRTKAVIDAGYDPLKPPMHCLEAHPLMALAMNLVEEGKAGIEGEFYSSHGILNAVDDIKCTSSGRSFWLRLEIAGFALYVSGGVPEAIKAGIPEKTKLVEMIQLPLCSDPDINNAVASIEVKYIKDRFFGGKEQTGFILHKTDLIAIARSPASIDCAWKDMKPKPQM